MLKNSLRLVAAILDTKDTDFRISKRMGVYVVVGKERYYF